MVVPAECAIKYKAGIFLFRSGKETMIAKFYREAGNLAPILSTSQYHQLSFAGIHLQSAGTEPSVKRCQGALHAKYDVPELRLSAANQELGIFGVLNDYRIFSMEAQIVGKDRIEQRTESRALKNTDAIGKWSGCFIFPRLSVKLTFWVWSRR